MNEPAVEVNEKVIVSEVKKMNFFQRLTGVIFSPEATMKDLDKKPRIAFPIILIALINFLFILILPLI
jgi:hypothetical protein